MSASAPKLPVFALIGPTAVGKTDISLELAAASDCEIISVDSRQVYRYLDIGTDKISPRERRRVLHHLIDVADPDEIFTAADFVTLAEAAISRIRARGRIPLLVGGSPMYYRALEGGFLSEDLPKDADVRRELEAESSAFGSEGLHRRLAEVDPTSAEKIHPHDKLRIIRALEIHRLTGRRPSDLYRDNGTRGGAHDIVYFGVDSDRELLYRRIESRVRQQFAAGYVEEVEWLLRNGFSPELPALQGFGYREIVSHIKGDITCEDAILGDIKSTKAFSRRQMTWFKQFKATMWYDLGEMTSKQAVESMTEIINKTTGEHKN